MPENQNPGSGAGESSEFYKKSMQELIDAGFLQEIPKSPGGGSYAYYNYGPKNTVGALMVTQLETMTPSKTGVPPSCRPFASLTNWCSNIRDSKYYCICNPY